MENETKDEWVGPAIIEAIYPNQTIKVINTNGKQMCLPVQRIKHYYKEPINIELNYIQIISQSNCQIQKNRINIIQQKRLLQEKNIKNKDMTNKDLKKNPKRGYGDKDTNDKLWLPVLKVHTTMTFKPNSSVNSLLGVQDKKEVISLEMELISTLIIFSFSITTNFKYN